MSNSINGISGSFWPQQTYSSGSLGAGSTFQNYLAAQMTQPGSEEKTYGALGSDYFNASAQASQAAYIASMIGKLVSGTAQNVGSAGSESSKTQGVVTGVSFSNGSPVLQLNNGYQMLMGDVESISDASAYLAGNAGGAGGAQGAYAAGALGAGAVNAPANNAPTYSAPVFSVPAETRTVVPPLFTTYPPGTAQSNSGTIIGGGTPTYYISTDWSQIFMSQPNLFYDGVFEPDPSWVPNEDGSYG